MSFAAILDTLLFKPLQLLFEVIYVVTNRVIGNPGLSIIMLSLIMNFLLLPLYRRADAIQEEERDIEARLHKGVTHIKKTFAGDERMMMLQTYYRQNNYKPTYVLRGAVSLFLEIPFFIAAYRFLSGLQLLNGVSLGPILDLGRPDGLLSFGGTNFNILPVIMTSINLVSCVIFTKGSPLKSKIQLYAMAIFFLFFLYDSPSGLVFYWTLNNTFSLVKTIFYKLKNPGKILGNMCSIAGIGVLFYGLFLNETQTVIRTAFFVGCGILMQAPWLYPLFGKRIHFNFKNTNRTGNKKIFLAGGLFLSVLTGILIPSAVINASPQEFINSSYFYHPLWFVVSSFCLALGLFVVWLGVFYWLARPSVRQYFDKLIWIFSGIGVLNYMFFGKNLGILTARLKYENGLEFAGTEQLGNIIIVVIVACALYIIFERWYKSISEVLMIGVLAFAILSTINIRNINSSIKVIKEQTLSDNEVPTFTLSKTGKNVVILMLDRAMGEYVPYIFNEKPELKQRFSGFVYYSNTMSFGGYTNFGVPAILGGYEYTPVEINKRSEESLVSKQNEALKVMPVLFDQNGFKVTVCNPTYANYQWIPDLSIYDDYPQIRSYLTGGKFADPSIGERWVQDNSRNFFCYSILKSTPLCFQRTVYDQGKYNQAEMEEEIIYSEQVLDSMFTSSGISANFMDNYNVLANLPNICDITENENNTFLFMTNDVTHEPMMLQEPNYEPSQYVDNTEYEEDNQERFSLDGRMLKMETDQQVIHYQTNMATMIQLGKWFEYMRENDVYDNTRIILVSDHGRGLEHFDDFRIEDSDDLSYYYPLLMVKDFESEGFTTSEVFMTNGDVPTLAMEGIIENPRNPFTGKIIDSSAKAAPLQYVIGSHEWDIAVNNGNTFIPSRWYSVHDDMRDKDNWAIAADNAILPVIE